jgi:hypothetical protein
MSEANWTYATGGLDAAAVSRGVTNGIARPNGGGNFCFGFHSKANTLGAVALYTNQLNFAPMAKGGRLHAAIQRMVSGGPLNFSIFAYLGLQANAVTANGYLLGLSDEDPHCIVLRKGPPSEGLPSEAANPPSTKTLRKSVATFTPGTWLHLRLDMIVNGTGDVILKCLRNDLALNPVTAPVWAAEPGMDDFVDDALGINTGSAPYLSGYGGFGWKSSDVTRRGAIDHVEIFRQL